MGNLYAKKAMAVAITATTLALVSTACSGPAENADGAVEISMVVQNQKQNIAAATALVEAFEAENPNIHVQLETQVPGTEGDNLTKTKLATGEMEDVFYYNAGSLAKALNPDQSMVPLDGEAWVGNLNDAMKAAVSTDSGIYGAPWGATRAGAVVYNKKVYADLGLSIPTSWDEFAANNEKIKAAGITPVIQTYGDTWTSQMFVLGNAGNVLAQDGDWAEEYTAGKRRYADQPAKQAFLNQQEGFEAGWWNKDFASATLEDGVRMVATGEGAQYPILTTVIVSTIKQNYPDSIDNVGLFALPAQDPSDTTLTIWPPSAFYIPKTTEGAKLDAAKRLIAFTQSETGCEIQNKHLAPSGPFATSSCKLPEDVPGILKDMQAYFDAGKTKPALEYLSPVKGPNLENYVIEVGSGIRSADDAAARYDEDVKKQAQQLGLAGW